MPRIMCSMSQFSWEIIHNARLEILKTTLNFGKNRVSKSIICARHKVGYNSNCKLSITGQLFCEFQELFS